MSWAWSATGDTGDGPALAVSDHILLMVVHALRRHSLDQKIIRHFAYAIRDLAIRSSGGYHQRVPQTIITPERFTSRADGTARSRR